MRPALHRWSTQSFAGAAHQSRHALGHQVATATLGHPAGEFVIPLIVIACIAAFGGRATWLTVAALLALVVAFPLLVLLGRAFRTRRR